MESFISRAGDSGTITAVIAAYMLRCADGSYYVGSTRNLEHRIEQHVLGRGSGYTSRRMPVELVWCEAFDRIDEAYAREKQVQGWSRAKRQALIGGRVDDLRLLAKKDFR
ncbi:MAG TPA: GIY-YIG nuclease family protein [Pseudolysinimonas sp.]